MQYVTIANPTLQVPAKSARIQFRMYNESEDLPIKYLLFLLWSPEGQLPGRPLHAHKGPLHRQCPFPTVLAQRLPWTRLPSLW